MTQRLPLVFAAMLCGASLTAQAELLFERKSSAHSTEFTYRWSPDVSLTFQLANKALNQYRDRKRYMPHLASQAVRHALLRKAGALQHQGVRVQFSPANMPLQYTVQAKDPQLLSAATKELAAAESSARNDYLYQGYFYLLDDPVKGKGVVPDHLRYFSDALPQLQPVADAFIAKFGRQHVRQIAQRLTEWIQQIPYRDLENRQTSNGSGYQPPVQLLFDHSGDCDSKAVLWASVMRLIFPSLQIRILYLPEHAIIAAQVPALDSEQIIDFADATLLLIDPTGPAPLKLGQVDTRYQAYLQSRQFTDRTFPTRSP